MSLLGGRNHTGWWVTIANNDLHGYNALALAASLRASLTSGKLCALVGLGVSQEMQALLEQAFDYTVLNPTDGLTAGGITCLNLSIEAKLTMSVWKCGFAETIVYLHPCSFVLRNSDELFGTKEDFAIIPPDVENSQFTTSVFVLRPNVGTFNEMMAHVSSNMNNNSTTEALVGGEEVLNSFFNRNGCRNLGALGREYNWVVGEELDSHFLNPRTKIIRFSTDTPWKLQISKSWAQLYRNVAQDLPIQLLGNNKAKLVNGFTDVPSTGEPNEITRGQKPAEEVGKGLGDAIAIIGLECRFPGANNEHEFWDLLLEGRDETKPLPPERFFTKLNLEKEADPPAGYLKCPIDEFDAKFFEISPRAAEYMDPQQRLLLEVTWEALERAGINPLSLNGSNTAVFVGLWMQEYLEYAKQGNNVKSLGLEFQHKYLGNAVCVSSAQISHFLGLRGPSVAFEAGCASALAGFHYACEALKSHETDLALSCGVNIATAGLGGGLGQHESFLHSKDGKCKTFDESADGFARAEACVTLVLKRMSDAVRDDNEILGIIRGTALNHCGAGSPLGTPNVSSQTLVLNTALQVAGIGPNDVSYVEAHGTGTVVGDPIEFQALNQVFGSAITGRSVPLHVASVKTNIGHTEAASGLAGLVKVLLAMRHRTIPRHLHLKTLNPNINLNEIPAIIPQINTEWKPSSRHGLIAGVSSFGFSGTNVHVILQEPPSTKKLQLHPTNHATELERTNHVIALSAKSEQALQNLVASYISLLESDCGNLHVPDLAYSANTGRAHFRHFRLAIVAKDTTQLLARLKKENHISKNVSKTKQKIAFLFTGQGSQYVNMAQTLYATHPVFKSAFHKCARLLKTAHDLDLGEILGYDNNYRSRAVNQNQEQNLNDSIYSQPAIFCIEICLAELWASFGIVPDYVLGHSVGEFAAAVVAGVLTLEEGMTLVVGRSKLVNTIRPGAMLVVKSSEQFVKRLIVDFQNSSNACQSSQQGGEQWIDIAAINSTSEVVLSGTLDAITNLEMFVQKSKNGVGTQRLAATHAFHSRDMNLILKEYKQILNSIRTEGKSLRCRYISGTFGRELSLSDFQNENEYWLKHVRDTVNFSKAIGRLVEMEEGMTINAFVEIGPQPVLLSLGMNSMAPETVQQCCWCPSIRKTEDNWVTLLTSLSKIYMLGMDVDWSRFDQHFPRHRVPLPTYPWQHEKFWLKGVSLVDSSVVVNARKAHPLLGTRIPSPLIDAITYCNSISLDHLPYIRDHKVTDKVILPAAGYLEMIMAAGRDVLCVGQHAQLQLTVENLIMESALPLVEQQSTNLQVVLIPKTVDQQLHYDVRIYLQTAFDPSGSDGGRWKKLASAKFLPCGTNDRIQSNDEPAAGKVKVGAFRTDRDSVQSKCTMDIEKLKAELCFRESVDDIYNKFMETGLNLGPMFKTMHRMWYSETQLLVEVLLPKGGDRWDGEAAYTCHPLVLDAMIQSCVTEFMRCKEGDKALYLPIKINKCVLMAGSYQNQNHELYVHYFRPTATTSGSQGSQGSENFSKPEELELELGAATSGNLMLYNRHGSLLAYMQGVEFAQTSISAFLRILATTDENELPDFYEEIWQEQLAPNESRVRPSSDHSRLEECEDEAMKTLGYKESNYFHSESTRTRQANIDELCYWYIVRALRYVGWNYCVGDQVSILDFIKMAQVLPNHKQLLHRWFDVLQEVGDLCINVKNPELGRIVRQFPAINEVETKIAELHVWFIENYDEVEHEFVTNCGEELAQVLCGKTSAHSVLFPQTPGIVGAAAYYRSFLGNYLHVLDGLLVGAQLRRMVTGVELESEEIQALAVFRVLEVGAGTGSTTTYILAQLDASGMPYEYTFTDISPTLINEARKRYSDLANPNIKCKVLNIEEDPKAQGFAPHYYDCVIADNVLHATRSLSETLTNLRHLLVPGGQLVFTEIVANIRTIDISFGLLDSWWRFKDYDVRTKNPVVSTQTWFKLLKLNGFVNPSEYNNVDGMDVRSFVAFAGPEKYAQAPMPSTLTSANRGGHGQTNKRTWLIFGFQDDQISQHLTQQFRLVGRDIIEVHGDPSATSLERRSMPQTKDSTALVYTINPLGPSHFNDLCNQLPGNDHDNNECQLEGILYLWGIHSNFSHNQDPARTNSDFHLQQTSGGLLHLIQAFNKHTLKFKPNPKLVVLTRGSQYVGEEQQPSNPIGATLSGILISYMNEFPNHAGVTIDMDPDPEADLYTSCQDVFHQIWLDEAEPQVAFRSHKKYVRRLVKAGPYKPSLVFPSAERYKLGKLNRTKGTTTSDSGVHIMVDVNKEVGEDQVEIRIVATTLNMAPNGRKQTEREEEGLHELNPSNSIDNAGILNETETEAEFGLAFSGIVCSVGSPGPSNRIFKKGDRVFGLRSGGALATHVVVQVNRISHIPERMSFEDVVTLPLGYISALYLLVHKGQLKPTDRVLIHGASGGVGLAAIQVAKTIGSEIYATARSTSERVYLQSLGIQNVYDSRDPNYCKKILADTNGTGVTICLNALSTDTGSQGAAPDVLSHGGRLLEMPPINGISATTEHEVRLQQSLRPDAVYQNQEVRTLIKLSELSQGSPSGPSGDGYGQAWNLFLTGLALGKYRPLPYTRFPLSRVKDAFRFLQEAKHIGEVIVRMPTTNVQGGQIEHREELFNSYGTYLISGGLGGLGLEVAKWMVNSGAKYIVLVGRSPPTSRAKSILSELRNNGANVLVQSADISDIAACKRVLAHINDSSLGFPPLRGIMQSAGALADNLLINQDLNAFMKVYQAKVKGTWNLHFLTLDCDLEHFVLFSSMVGGLGGLGQANHCAANKYLDSFAKFRTQQGLPCCSINWGAWSEVGAAISKEGMLGFRSISPAQGVAALQRAMLSQQINTTVYNVGDLKMLTSTYNLGSYFSLLEADERSKSEIGTLGSSMEFESCVQAVRDSDSAERKSKIKEFIAAVVRDTLRLAETEPIDPDQNLREMGIDSMMAMEVRSKVQQLLTGFDMISLNELQENLTINMLATLVNDHMNKRIPARTEEDLLTQIAQDSVLPEDILPNRTQNQNYSSHLMTNGATTDGQAKANGAGFSCVLLTGVTGHFAPYVLEELLASDPSMHVYCLIRASSDQKAQDRLNAVLDELRLIEAIDMSRVHCIAGDVAMTSFGLNEKLYKQLCHQIDSIMHCAAVVNLSLPYIGEIRNNNILGLLNVLRFATSGRNKPLQFASSISAQVRLQDDGTMLDEFPSSEDSGESLKTGYHVSKFVCEKLLKQALDRELPVSVVRHNYLVGDSRNGLAPSWRNPIVMFLFACMRVGKFPEIGAGAHLSTVAVNISAKVAVRLFLHPNLQHGMYNINNRKVRRFFDLAEIIRERGRELEMVPYNEWKAALVSNGVDLNLDAKWLVETLLPSEVFKQNVVIDLIKNGSTDACQRMWSNSLSLKKYVPNVDALMVDPIELVKLQMEYYEKTFDKSTT